MIKSFLIAAAIMIATPGVLFSQELFFWSFDDDALTTTATAQPGTTGTAYIFASEAIRFVNGTDIDFTSSDSSVLLLTGGAGINDPFPSLGTPRFASSVVTIDPLSSGAAGNWSADSIGLNAVNDETLIDPNYVPGVGHLVAQVDYSIVEEGTATLDLISNTSFVNTDPNVLLRVTFGSATITASAVPEASSAILLVLGSIGLVTRRRRA